MVQVLAEDPLQATYLQSRELKVRMNMDSPLVIAQGCCRIVHLRIAVSQSQRGGEMVGIAFQRLKMIVDGVCQITLGESGQSPLIPNFREPRILFQHGVNQFDCLVELRNRITPFGRLQPHTLIDRSSSVPYRTNAIMSNQTHGPIFVPQARSHKFQ